MTRTPTSPSTAGIGPTIARRGLMVAMFVLGAASCSRLPVSEIAANGQGPTTTYVTTPPTSAPITSASSTTVPGSVPKTTVTTTISPSTTLAPTTAAPTTAAPTTTSTTIVPSSTTAVADAPATTAPPTTMATTTTLVAAEELEELPYTGPSEAVLFALIGLTMVVAGRSVLDLTGVLSRFGRVGRNLPPR